MKIGRFDTRREVFVVAEVGNNHEGDAALAEKMLVAAAKAGASAVKFQTFKTEDYVNPVHDAARYKRMKGFELTHDDFRRLAKAAEDNGVLFLSSPFDLGSAQFLNPLVPAFKIASGDNDFQPLMRFVAKTGKPIILSSGLADTALIRRAKDFIEGVWKENGIRQELTVLHCVSSYPVPDEQANLASIPHLAAELGCDIGYSDHTLGIEASVLAAAMGARIIEKHFTLDKNHSDFRDHKLSATPDELAELVRRVKDVTRFLGTPGKKLEECEKPNLPMMRRSIAAGRDLPADAALAFEDLIWVRPAAGLPCGDEAKVVGRKLSRAVKKGDLLTPDILK